MSQTALFSLLEDVVKDHPTYKFPIQGIQPELTSLYFGQKNFDSICASILLKLKRKHSKVIPHLFYLALDKTFPNGLNDVDLLEADVYMEKIEDLINFLSRLNITRVPLNSPDGYMISEMS